MLLTSMLVWVGSSIPSNLAPVAGGVIAFLATQRLQGGRAQLALCPYQSAPADGTRPQGHHNREQIALYAQNIF